MVSDDVILPDLLPFGDPDMVVSANQRVTNEARVTHDVDEIVPWHSGPKVAIDISIVDL